MSGSHVLSEIFSRGAVRHGDEWIELHSHVSEDEGRYLQDLVTAADATRTLEVGMAYGISTVFILEALAKRTATPSHIAIDPFQNSDWKGIGLANVDRAGYRSLLEFHEAPSEFVLPGLASAGRTIDFALIDGWHSFDHALVEFFYVSRMLRVGGIVAFDDADWPGLTKLMRFILTLPGYALYGGQGRTLAPSAVGRLRQRLADTGVGQRLLRPEFRRRNWELGIHHRCVAFQKLNANALDMRFFRDF